MAHDHSHGNRNDYYLNQLFTIAVCGALGGVTVMLWYNGKLRFLVVERFWLPTLIGGITLLVLVLIRAIAVWRSVDETNPPHDHDHCGHDHDHCGHEHAHDIQSAARTSGFSSASTSPPLTAPVPHHHHDHGHDHGHDHDHEHGWAPWRYVVLLLPVVLFFLNLPNKGKSAEQGDRLKETQLTAPTNLRSKKWLGEVGFAELQQASLTPEQRESFEEHAIALIGQYSEGSDTRFTLVRYKMACCARDAVPLNAVIMIDPKSEAKVDRDTYRNKWVEVRGLVHFFPKPGSSEFITAIILSPTKDEPIGKFIRVLERPPASPYLN